MESSEQNTDVFIIGAGIAGLTAVAEVSSAALLLYLGQRSVLFGISLGVLALIWGSTWLCLIPLHRKLSHGYDAPTVQRLVRANTWRTVGWTVRDCVLPHFFYHA